MSETELTMHRPITPEGLNESLARRPPAKRQSEAETFRLIGKFVQERIDQACKPLRERIEKLEQRGYKGTHQRALSYVAQSLVTHDGALWFAVRDVLQGEVPGRSDGWQLAAKNQQHPPRAPTAPRS